jgi:hypothetical protein
MASSARADSDLARQRLARISAAICARSRQWSLTRQSLPDRVELHILFTIDWAQRCALMPRRELCRYCRCADCRWHDATHRSDPGPVPHRSFGRSAAPWDRGLPCPSQGLVPDTGPYRRSASSMPGAHQEWHVRAFPALATKDRQVHWARCIIVLQGQLSPGIRPRACTEIRYVVGSYDLGRHAATPLGATWLVR